MWKRVLVGAILLAAAAAALVYYRESQPVRFARLLWGRSERCSLGDVWRSLEANQRLWDRIGEIAEGMKQIESDPAGFELIEAGQQRFWVPPGNQAGLAEMLGEQEAEVYGAAGRGVRPGDVVLDCGANVGVYTRHALEAGARLVVAIELAPENLTCLRRNFAPEIDAGRVIVYPKGVWDRDDELQLNTSQLSGGDSVALQVPGSRQGPRVPLTTIDKLVEELRLERVDLIKMDIEGSERRALAGARQTVARFHPRLAISMEHEPDDAEAIPALVRKLWPELKTECGPCVWVHTALVNRAAPEVLFAGPVSPR